MNDDIIQQAAEVIRLEHGQDHWFARMIAQSLADAGLLVAKTAPQQDLRGDDEYAVGMPDPDAGNDDDDGCDAGSSTGYLCTRSAMHQGTHAASDGDTILHVWKDAS